VLQNPRPFSATEIEDCWARYFAYGTIERPEQLIAILCREMGWTYEQYLDQPTWFVQSLMYLLSEEAKAAKQRQEAS
jgi:hypothetical protein